MKSLFLFTLITLSSVIGLQASTFNDYLSDQDIEELEQRAIELKKQTGFSFRIEYGSINETQSFNDPNQPSLILVLDFQNEEGSIQSNIYEGLLNASYFERLDFLYIDKGFESNTLKESILLMIADIERTSTDEFLLKKVIPEEEDSDSFNREFLQVFYFFLFVGFVYAIKSAHKITRSTNKAEYWQYYGFNRMTFNQKTVVSVLVIGFVVVFIFQYVYFYEEIILLYLCLAFVGRPMVLFGGHVYKLIDDNRFAKKIEVHPPSHLSLGQKLYLLKPNLQTEEYLLLDIYELLINRHLIITAELKEPAHLNRYRNFISRNLESEMDKTSSFQQFVVDIFPSDKEQYYLIHPLINKIMGELMSFKHYKKDFLILDLVKQGFVTPKSWASNTFSVTPAGKQYKDKLNQKIRDLRIKVDEYIHGSGQLEVGKLNGEILLVSNSEKKVDELYDKLLNDFKIDEGRQSKIGVILEPSFSFHEYRHAIRNKIRDDYESRLGNPSHWTDDY